jgi:hypothetical protein
VAGACLLMVGLSALGVSAAGGAAPVTLYAGASASGSANCSSAANACTLSTALADTAPSDVVALVTAGVEGTASTYYSGGFSIGTAGTSAALPLVIEPAPGVTNPILDGGGSQTVLNVTNNMHLVIDGVTIQSGNSTTGGGITNNSGGVLAVNDSTFTANTASGENGGAIDNGDGGNGTLTVSDSTFHNNTAFDGGAIDNGDGGNGTLTVSDSTFDNNAVAVAGDGGAIDNGDGGNGTLTVSDSTFDNNAASDAGDGGAINDCAGTLSVSDSTFASNTADDGGAIDNGDHCSGTLTVSDSTFASNTATRDGGAIDNGDFSGTGSAEMAADIFAGSCSRFGGSWTDLGYNVGSDTTCQNGGTGDAVSASLASELGPLANNGGPTQTMALLAGNPAAGLIPNGSGLLCPLVDQTGAASPSGAPCNAGALQIHPNDKSVKIGGTASVPKVTIKGSGFGIPANLGPATASCGGFNAGSDYPNTLYVTDVTRSWTAGNSEDCNHIGLYVTSYSDTNIVFHFGKTLASYGGMHSGDKVEVTLFGTTTTITAPV